MWWNAHALPLTDAWWNAPMYLPMQGTFAFAEALLALVPLSTPLQWLGVGPIATHNVLYVLSGPLATLAAYQLAHRLTARWDAALIAALAFGFSPYRIGQMAHIQVLWSCWMPFALVALHDYVRTDRPRALVWFGLCWMMNGFTNGYFLVYFPVLVGVWVLWFSTRWQQAAKIGVVAFLASLPLLPMLLGYRHHQGVYGFARRIGEIRDFSADLTAIFAASSRAWVSAHWTLPPGPEGELYPGLVLLGLVIVGCVLAMRRNSRETHARWSVKRRIVVAIAALATVLAVIVMSTGGYDLQLGPLSISMHRPSRLFNIAFWLGLGALVTSGTARRAWQHRSPLAFYAAAAALMYFLALGPEPRIGATQLLYKSLYSWLMLLPGFDSVRVPARFGLLMILCLSGAAALAYARMVPRATRIGALALCVAALLEGWIIWPVEALPRPLDVPARAISAGAAVMEMPVVEDFAPNTVALFNQMHNGRPLINGFGGYLPGHYYALMLGLKDGDTSVIEGIRTVAPIAAFVWADRDKDGATASLMASVPDVEMLEKSDRGTWYLLPKHARGADIDTSGSRLTPSRIDANVNEPEIKALTDGDGMTRWNGRNTSEGNTDIITLSFANAVAPAVVEMDQGIWAGSYPRDLEIVLVTDTGDVSVYRGSTANLSMQAALVSKDVVMHIAIPPGHSARSIKLISHPKGQPFVWSVGELRVFGFK